MGTTTFPSLHVRERNAAGKRRVCILCSLAGAAFCIAAAIGALDSACITSGCELYRGTSFLGLSLWWWGAACFVTLGGLCFRKHLDLARGLAAVALGVDILLLGWMALSATCVNCLLAGSLFALVFLCLYSGKFLARPAMLTLGVVWLCALTPNLAAVAQETAQPWIIAGPQVSPVRLYFSPSCPACRKALHDMAGNEGVAYVPVPKSGTDLIRMAHVTKRLAEGASLAEAVDASAEATELPEHYGFGDRMRLRWNLFLNRVTFRRFGSRNLPLMTTVGWYGETSDANAAHTATPQKKGV
ncbi:hypothetical protein GGQ74_002240 [Desulfobaculum xiamenense]|uniref:Vitamin K epoxide reductase family protein n=1 Tax=Desulfobaculum xiamenense TaxID=995050 RepID=A0A846QN01_9BACT|nr:hypothetical protein [Desulfobaculum xiamenense]NJB68567.1 hypothetical protein [Desulfobaculum xiamenense]